jgi:hypothetical protein
LKELIANEVTHCLASLAEKLSHRCTPVRTPNKNTYFESFFSTLELEFLSGKRFMNPSFPALFLS